MTIAKLDDRIQMRDVDAILGFLPRFRDLDPNQACIRWPGIRIEDGQPILDHSQESPACHWNFWGLYMRTALFRLRLARMAIESHPLLPKIR